MGRAGEELLLFFYLATKTVRLSGPHLVKFLPAATEPASAPLGAVFMGAAGEIKLVRDALAGTYGVGADKDLLRIYTDTHLANTKNFPVRLGRHSLNLTESGQEVFHENESEPLLVQLQQLRARHGEKSHFRIALVNGFGTNLGDNLIGASALRIAIGVLQRYLPSVCIDPLLGVSTNGAVASILQAVSHVGRVTTSGITLAEFIDYDAYFDFSNLLERPNYSDLSAIDFYLWWMGLNPELVSVPEKRNRMSLTPSVCEDVHGMVSKIAGRKILFSHRSSVPLRSFPRKQARKFVMELLAIDSELTVIVDYSLGLQHPRLLNLDGKINNVERLKALVSQVDGVIAVASFPFHLADAAAVPAVLLSSSLSLAYMMPYYPHAVGLLLPGAEKLPGWGKVKVNSNDWKTMEPAYVSSWGGVNVLQVLLLLEEKIAQRTEKLNEAPPNFTFAVAPTRHKLVDIRLTDEGVPDVSLSLVMAQPYWRKSMQVAQQICRRLVWRGSTVVQCGAGIGDLSLELAAAAGSQGRVYVFEPRRLYFQTLCARALLGGYDRIFAYQFLPFALPAHSPVLKMADLDLLASHEECLTGNMHTKVGTQGKAIDELQLHMCRLLLIQPPFDPGDIIAGAADTIERCRPFIAAASLLDGQLASLRKALGERDYHEWRPAGLTVVSSGTKGSFFLAAPSECRGDLKVLKSVVAAIQKDAPI